MDSAFGQPQDESGDEEYEKLFREPWRGIQRRL